LLLDRQVRSRAGKIAASNRLPLIQQPKPLPVGPRTAPPSMTFVVAALAVVSIGFGGNFLAIRVVVHALPPFTLQAIRFLLAGIVLYLFASVALGLQPAYFAAMALGGNRRRTSGGRSRRG
jgi:hypothetical protein